MNSNPLTFLGAFVFVVAIVLGVCIIVAYPFMLIWNMSLVPAISVLNPISFWQAFFICIFCTTFIRGYNTGSKS